MKSRRLNPRRCPVEGEPGSITKEERAFHLNPPLYHGELSRDLTVILSVDRSYEVVSYMILYSRRIELDSVVLNLHPGVFPQVACKLLGYCLNRVGSLEAPELLADFIDDDLGSRFPVHYRLA